MDNRVAMAVGAAIGLAGSLGINVLAEPGARLIPSETGARKATEAEAPAADALASAIFGSPDFANYIELRRMHDGWRVDARGYVALQLSELPATGATIVGEMDSGGPKIYEREKERQRAAVADAAAAAAAQLGIE